MAKESTEQLIAKASEIADEYDGNLTLRQLYYQLVARSFIPNSQESYKRLVGRLTDARLTGEFPITALLDRTREARPGAFLRCQVDALDAANNIADELRQGPESWIHTDLWFGQRKHVSVWVEKEALAGVFEDPCTEVGVAWFVLRGYSSVSALYEYLVHLQDAHRINRFDEAVVLYFGDHDPDGWEIPRSAARNLDRIIEVEGMDVPPIRFERKALLREQIDQYDPPPFPAKETSARFNGYIKEHGTKDAWELDALRPDVLRRLILQSAGEHFDHRKLEHNERLVQAAREDCRKIITAPDWARKALNT